MRADYIAQRRWPPPAPWPRAAHSSAQAVAPKLCLSAAPRAQRLPLIWHSKPSHKGCFFALLPVRSRIVAFGAHGTGDGCLFENMQKYAVLLTFICNICRSIFIAYFAFMCTPHFADENCGILSHSMQMSVGYRDGGRRRPGPWPGAEARFDCLLEQPQASKMVAR